MKFTVFCTFLICVAVVAAQDKYVTKFKSVDLDEILKNERLLNAYYKCLLDGTGCTADGDELRNTLPDAIQNGCVKCTRDQKDGTKKIADYLMKEKPEWWKQLIDKYDPDNVYRTKFQDRLKAEGISI